MRTLAIVGGGAAGLVAAIAAGFIARKHGGDLDIHVYERDDRVGRSILATGNGRCNFSNAHIDAADYHNGPFVQQVFDALEHLAGTPDAVHGFFRSLGLQWREEADGRQYPLANKASSVLDVLRAVAQDLGVREICDSDVAAIDPPRQPQGRFTIRMANGVLKRSDGVIIASGGRTISALEIPELARIAPKPVLGPLAVSPRDVELTRELDNIRVRCGVRLVSEGSQDANDDEPLGRQREVTQLAGELMFRKYGVSGICIFDLSRFAQRGDHLVIDLLHELQIEDVASYLSKRRALLQNTLACEPTYSDMLRGILLPRVSEALLKRAGIHPRDVLEEDGIAGLEKMMCSLSLKVEGIADPGLCQIRRGGFAVSGFDPSTLGARAIPGIYAAGEALDVDGPCGGFNLHWAWASGLVAGCSAGEALLKGPLS